MDVKDGASEAPGLSRLSTSQSSYWTPCASTPDLKNSQTFFPGSQIDGSVSPHTAKPLLSSKVEHVTAFCISGSRSTNSRWLIVRAVGGVEGVHHLIWKARRLKGFAQYELRRGRCKALCSSTFFPISSALPLYDTRRAGTTEHHVWKFSLVSLAHFLNVPFLKSTICLSAEHATSV